MLPRRECRYHTVLQGSNPNLHHNCNHNHNNHNHHPNLTLCAKSGDSGGTDRRQWGREIPLCPLQGCVHPSLPVSPSLHAWAWGSGGS